jgi:6-phosphogluconolactonase
MAGSKFSRAAQAIALALFGSFALGATAISTASAATATPTHRVVGHLYTETNASAGNAIAVFDRLATGRIRPAGLVPTGGKGTGADLGDQGALAFSRDHRWLFAVNGGSDSVSAFRLARNGKPVLRNTVPSAGSMPVSVTEARGVVYVVNAGGSNITGFTLDRHGLSPLAGSTLPLSGDGVGPAQIQFAHDGWILTVTEKNTNLIDVYRVDRAGRPHGPVSSASSGQTPFGFAFSHGHLFVSEAFGGADGASATSSYRIDRNGSAHAISASVRDGQTAACWVTIGGRVAFVTNTGSNDVSTYRIGADGTLTLIAGSAGSTGMGPQDMALSRDGRYLYNINEADGSISAFRVGAGGTLRALKGASGLPKGSIAGLLAN